VPRAIRIIVIALPFIGAVAHAADMRKEGRFIVSCTAFSANFTATELAARYGSGNVRADKIHIGEGEYEDGTVLYSDQPKRRAELVWEEQDNKPLLRMIRITGAESQWQTSQGLTLGLTLRAVEKLNRRPFRLSGFGWDYGGTTISWSGGSVESKDSKDCGVWARFQSEPSNPAEIRLLRQVSGDREFSSGHPAMQAVNARVYQFGLYFADRK
jgi:hypothetical protein